jgi:hypothetical protein
MPKINGRSLDMAKVQVFSGIIEQKETELYAVEEQQAENVRAYKAIWEERNIAAAAGDKPMSIAFEGRYYHLRDTVGAELDRKRLDLDRELEDLRAEAYKLTSTLRSLKRTEETEKDEYEALVAENERRLEDKRREMEVTRSMMEETKRRLSELEGAK